MPNRVFPRLTFKFLEYWANALRKVSIYCAARVSIKVASTNCRGERFRDRNLFELSASLMRKSLDKISPRISADYDSKDNIILL